MSMEKGSAVGASARGIFMWRVVAVLVTGALLAHWTWVLLAPVSVHVLSAAQHESDIPAEHLFGVAAPSESRHEAALPNVRLVGVFAGTPGFAIFELDGKRQVGLVTGRELVAGAKLVEVAKDHVVIERRGVREQIQIEKKLPARVEGEQATAVSAPAS
ncbi:MAG: type II secretion system protein N [Gallionella sp.]|nr:type II secretion system protein N [Gallionella sp.]